MTTLCCVDGCSKSIFSSQLCSSHYYKKRTYGSVTGGVDYQKKAQSRFLSSFERIPSGCHLWIKSKDRYGYGKLSTMRKSVQAHRFAWEFYNQQKIPEKMVVMHMCNNKSCVNPEHLKLGTQKENSFHAVLTGQSNVARLNADQVRVIKSSPLSSKELALAFGVTFSCIDDIRKGNTWKHI
jgi:hypothetical protein